MPQNCSHEVGTEFSPFAEGFLDGELNDFARLRLAGSRCRACGIALFGKRLRCENCSSKQVEYEVFSKSGTIYSFTIQRYPAPMPHALGDDWSPRVLAWIDLEDDGPRILGPVKGDISLINIGSKVVSECRPLWIDNNGRQVVTYEFLIFDNLEKDLTRG